MVTSLTLSDVAMDLVILRLIMIIVSCLAITRTDDSADSNYKTKQN